MIQINLHYKNTSFFMNKAHFRLIGCQREAMFSCMYYTGQNDYRRGIVATDRGEFTTAQSESMTIGRACPYTEGGTAPGDALPLLVHHIFHTSIQGYGDTVCGLWVNTEAVVHVMLYD